MAEVQYDFDHINRPIFIWHEKFHGPFQMLANHYHDAYEIYYLVEGERYYFIKDRTYDDLDLFSCFHQKTSVLRFNLIEQPNILQILSTIVSEGKKNIRG